MPVRATGGTLMLMGALVTAGTSYGSGTANAARTTPAVHKGTAADAVHAASVRVASVRVASVRAAARALQAGMRQAQRAVIYSVHHRAGHVARAYGWGGGLQCVPFARENSGIELVGNANTWWGGARGVYERGNRPEVGSVLSFRATRHMPLGHVAVVTKLVDGRTIEIDHANWSSAGRISRAVSVVDVSERNDWSAVRVELGQSGDYGAIYPVHGFIYDRPDRGVMVANTSFSPRPALSPAGRDHRPAQDRLDAQPYEEVAEAPDDRTTDARRHTVRAPTVAPARSAVRPLYLLLDPSPGDVWLRGARFTPNGR